MTWQQYNIHLATLTVGSQLLVSFVDQVLIDL